MKQILVFWVYRSSLFQLGSSQCDLSHPIFLNNVLFPTETKQSKTFPLQNGKVISFELFHLFLNSKQKSWIDMHSFPGCCNMARLTPSANTSLVRTVCVPACSTELPCALLRCSSLILCYEQMQLGLLVFCPPAQLFLWRGFPGHPALWGSVMPLCAWGSHGRKPAAK